MALTIPSYKRWIWAKCLLQTFTSSTRSSRRMSKHLSFPSINSQVIFNVVVINAMHSTSLFLDATISNVTHGNRNVPNNVNICESISDESYRCKRHLDSYAKTYVDLKGNGTLTSIRVFAEGKELHSCVGWLVSFTWIDRRVNPRQLTNLCAGGKKKLSWIVLS